MSRTESAAATRRALIAAAAALLDAGGPEAVTLRAVGTRSGVSRGAPYGHFRDKSHLLLVIAEGSWRRVGDQLNGYRADSALSPVERLHAALRALLEVGRCHPHLYTLMFNAPPGDIREAAAAASATQDEFLAIVADTVGGDAGQVKVAGALLLTSVHGIIGMESSGHLSALKWGTTAEELIARQVDLLASR